MKFVKYENKTPINLEHITAISKSNTLTNTKSFKIYFKQNDNTIQWDFKTNKEERDKTYNNIMNYIEPVDMKKRTKI